MTSCQLCGSDKLIISERVHICPQCAHTRPVESKKIGRQIRRTTRTTWNLPLDIPKDKEGKQCRFCTNQCQIPNGERGFCGIWTNENGRLMSNAGKNQAFLHTYYDPLPTNCCNTWFCPAGTDSGYPEFSYTKGPEIGYYNLACFMYGCNFDCFGCQNPSHKDLDHAERYSFDKFLSKAKNPRTSCICWFGGSPEPQLTWAIRASRRVIKAKEQNQTDFKQIMRICWEWNGAGNPKLVSEAVKLSLLSGGNAKFDLKYFTPSLGHLLSGVSIKQSFENFKQCYQLYYHRREEPVLSATTLLISGYTDSNEVKKIAEFIADIDPTIPYSLLVFFPALFLGDLPITPKKQIEECYQAATEAGLKRINIGNKHLI
ncbi:MAG: radical SAM protein [Candidatus Hodarchaeales archaeon]